MIHTGCHCFGQIMKCLYVGLTWSDSLFMTQITSTTLFDVFLDTMGASDDEVGYSTVQCPEINRGPPA